MTHLSNFFDLPVEEKKDRGLLFTPGEIAQQPATWGVTLQIFREQQQQICAFLDRVGVRDALEQRPAVVLIGAGTSDYIGQSLELLFRQKWGCEVSSVASTDLLPNLEDYVVPGQRYLWISFSRSGDSPEGVAVIERATQLYPEIAHLVVTCNKEARMAVLCKHAKASCVVVLDDAVNDRSLVMTSSFTNMVIMGHCLANAWSIEQYAMTLKALVHAGKDFLPRAAEQAERIAAQDISRVCIVGIGALAGVAKEAALKVLELTAGRMMTMSETVLGLRHGPMAALNDKTLFLSFASGDECRANYTVDLLKEISTKDVVAERIAIGQASTKAKLAPYCDLYLSLDLETEDVYRPVVDVIFGQLLGLYCSVAHGLKPDSPSPGGVINRVVQQFQIY